MPSAYRAIRLSCLAAALALLGVASERAAVAAPAKNENPREYCARVGDDDTLRSPSGSLADAIHRQFKIGGRYARYYRCVDGAVLLCAVGANLPCGKANTSTDLPAATRWCETHENSDFIPMVVTGHDTLYSWRCVGRAAKAVAPIGKLDARGFFADYWEKLE